MYIWTSSIVAEYKKYEFVGFWLLIILKIVTQAVYVWNVLFLWAVTMEKVQTHTTDFSEVHYVTFQKACPPPLQITAGDTIWRRCSIAHITPYDLAPTNRHSGRIVLSFQ
jgi:hypothetical protein